MTHGGARVCRHGHGGGCHPRATVPCTARKGWLRCECGVGGWCCTGDSQRSQLLGRKLVVGTHHTPKRCAGRVVPTRSTRAHAPYLESQRSNVRGNNQLFQLLCKFLDAAARARDVTVRVRVVTPPMPSADALKWMAPTHTHPDTHPTTPLL
jgi:hypothetical protein